jgi:hypothetical protein
MARHLRLSSQAPRLAHQGVGTQTEENREDAALSFFFKKSEDHYNVRNGLIAAKKQREVLPPLRAMTGREQVQQTG